jgi:hypothetical protein
MTGKDKTEERLLASIRKNKPAADAAVRQNTGNKAAPRNKVAQKTATQGRTASRAKPASQRAAQAKAAVYQFGRRVWPD